MLILTRRIGETIMIGEDVSVTVLRVKGNQVRLGINAPRSVSVQREEISEHVKSALTAAAGADDLDAADGVPRVQTAASR